MMNYESRRLGSVKTGYTEIMEQGISSNFHYHFSISEYMMQTVDFKKLYEDKILQNKGKIVPPSNIHVS